jgi:farnesyl-diphosphate farnesyltransferase
MNRRKDSPGQLTPARLLTSLLKGVSRSFYLTLRVLPGAIRPQIGLAYLLARTTDTIADTELVPIDQRLQALQLLREHILGNCPRPLDFGELARHQGTPAERVLLEQVEAALVLLRSLDPDDLARVRQVLDVITSGQELDLRRFDGASAQHMSALERDADLDDYTYRVAGCVGEFWTRMCRAHLFPAARLDDAALLADGIRFGKGLQLVNILRDLPKDLRQGRCYLPAEALARRNLKPDDLLTPGNQSRFRPVYDEWLARAEDHLRAGWRYTNALPRRSVRIRLACAWPILIGFETLRKLRHSNVLDPAQRIKINRSEVRRILWHSVLKYPFDGAWRGMVPDP